MSVEWNKIGHSLLNLLEPWTVDHFIYFFSWKVDNRNPVFISVNIHKGDYIFMFSVVVPSCPLTIEMDSMLRYEWNFNMDRKFISKAS